MKRKYFNIRSESEENNNQTSERQSKHEKINAEKFYKKWGGLPQKDQYGMICGIQ